MARSDVPVLNDGMKKFRWSVITATLLAAIPFIAGCVSPASNDGPVAVEGTVGYVDDSLQVFDPIPFSVAWNAALTALPEMQIPVTVTQKDTVSGRLTGHDLQNHAIVIQMLRKHRHLTEIRITVGQPGESDNRTQAKEIYDRIKARY